MASMETTDTPLGEYWKSNKSLARNIDDAISCIDTSDGSVKCRISQCASNRNIVEYIPV
jgi:hypothetical protein